MTQLVLPDGVAVFMGGESTSSRAVVQSAGVACRLKGQRLKDEFNQHGELLHLILRYTQSLITQMAQTAVCNRHHTIDQQPAAGLRVLRRGQARNRPPAAAAPVPPRPDLPHGGVFPVGAAPNGRARPAGNMLLAGDGAAPVPRPAGSACAARAPL